MPLGTDYATQDCSLARSLEMVGERWTLLILRDCFFGVRRFSDFQHHLGISKAVLTDRLGGLVDDGLLVRTPCGGREEYTLTPSGLAVWPALFALSQWGEAMASPQGPRRVFAHADCGTDLEASGRCPACRTVPGPQDLVMRPGPGAGPGRPDDPVSAALRSPRRLLSPVRGTTGR